MIQVAKQNKFRNDVYVLLQSQTRNDPANQSHANGPAIAAMGLGLMKQLQSEMPAASVRFGWDAVNQTRAIYGDSANETRFILSRFLDETNWSNHQKINQEFLIGILEETYRLVELQDQENILLSNVDTKQDLCKWFFNRIQDNVYILEQAFAKPYSENTLWAETRLLELEQLLNLPWLEEICSSTQERIYQVSQLRKKLSTLWEALKKSKSQNNQ